ncbi:LysR family transcriptional regulator [Ramlibacter sp.]|uniref:LysR family transcriptional regulator n=1 Tax=Ramlibacter sp. TaxID=1917967 RepID=UPI00178EF0C0|nr:LysR family transcriptional regulator [Ramlibacter sp.]MBA2672506.1 LysR family transcriptional regulator [Ramlibacter sp.]
MKSLDLNLLAALDALLATGSVAAAAQRMHLSAPAMSHTLARIRDALGDPILVRAGQKLVPTPRAEELRAPVRRLIGEAVALMQPGGKLDLAQLQREFTIRAPEGMGIVYGPALLAEIQQEIPLATLRFIPESDGDAAALREGRIDLDVGLVRDAGPEVKTMPLYEQRVVGVAKSGHGLLAARVTPKRFSGEQHVSIAQRGRNKEVVDTLLAEIGCARRIVLTVPSAYGALMAAARSSLIACVPEPLARTVAGGLGLEVFKLPVAIPAEQVVQAWHPRLDAEPAHQCLCRCVAALLGKARFGPLGRRAVAAHNALVS